MAVSGNNCPNCGAAVAPEAHFCANCGIRFAGPPTPRERAAEKIIVALIVFALVIAAVVALDLTR
jgi:predicted nucleic acid-binding Zn ribbon protein